MVDGWWMNIESMMDERWMNDGWMEGESSMDELFVKYE
jgi:hypothetical protein